MRKKEPETQIQQGEIHIGLGPGFEAGRNWSPRLVSPSASRRASGAAITSRSITQALTMLGVAPAMKVSA